MKARKVKLCCSFATLGYRLSQFPTETIDCKLLKWTWKKNESRVSGRLFGRLFRKSFDGFSLKLGNC
jgi:hypothetical protein